MHLPHLAVYTTLYSPFLQSKIIRIREANLSTTRKLDGEKLGRNPPVLGCRRKHAMPDKDTQSVYLQTSSPSIASCSSVLANDTRPPITAPIIYTNHVRRPETKQSMSCITEIRAQF